MVPLSRRQKAHVIVHNAAIAAAGIGAGWVSDLVFVPDTVPLFVLLLIMLLCLTLIFRLRPHKALLLSVILSLSATMLYWVGAMLGTSMLVSVLCAAGITEALGGLTYEALYAAQPRGKTEHPLIAAAVQASAREPWLGLVSSAPMAVALLAVFLVLDATQTATVRLHAPGGAVPLGIDHPLIDLREGLLHISGVPTDRGQRVDIAVHHDGLVAQLEEQVIPRRVAHVHVQLLLPPGLAAEQSLSAERDWDAGATVTWDYWQKVRGRLYLLVIGMLLSLTMVWLGHHRSRRPPVTP